jgi:hypothetical protein
MTLKKPSDEASLRRFAVKIQRCGDCWIWTGATTKGYSAFHFTSGPTTKEHYGHRASYRMFKGDIPEGLIVMHACDTPLCVNPAHLGVGTVKDNQADSRRKGRATVGSSSHYAKITEADVVSIAGRRLMGEKLRAIGKDFGISEASVCRNCAWAKMEARTTLGDQVMITDKHDRMDTPEPSQPAFVPAVQTGCICSPPLVIEGVEYTLRSPACL